MNTMSEGRGPRVARRNTVPLTALLASALATTLGWAAIGHAADLPGAFRGDAYATFANIKTGAVSAQLGRSANQPCPCRGTNGATLTNEVDGLVVGNNGAVLTAGVTVGTARTEKTATTALVRDVSTIGNLNALGGLITADTVTSVAEVDTTTTTMAATSVGSTLVNLKVAGVPIDANVAPNTVLDLAGFGTVTLNKIVKSGNFKKTGQILVEAVDITIAQSNPLGLPVGAQIVIAHAVAGYNRTVPAVEFAGQAYAALANDKVGAALQNRIGKVAFVSLGCEGSNGKVRSNSVTADSVDTVLSIGTGTTSAVSQASPSSAYARTTATVQGLSLLGGMVTASAINAVAQQTVAGGAITSSTDGSGFVGLTVAGIPVPLTVPPNTALSLPLLGEVVVNEQIMPVNPGDRVQVNGLHVKVGLNPLGLLGLPANSELVLAHADAGADPF